MKILMLSPHGTITATPRLGTTDTGGQVAFVLGLARALADRGHQVTVANRTGGATSFTSLGEGVELMRVGCGPEGFVPKEEIAPILGDFVDGLPAGFDVVVGHYWDGMAAAQRYALQADIPMVAMPHSLGKWKAEAMGQELHQVRHTAEMASMARAAQVVATSPLQAQVIERIYGSGSVVVPPGIDADFLANKEDAYDNWGRSSVLAVGRAAANKNYVGLVDAISLVRVRVPDVQLRLVMGGDEDAETLVMDRAMELGVTDAVFVYPRLPRADLLRAYRSAAVFALPSLYEPFGMTAVEAMGAGTVALVPTDGGLASMLPNAVHSLSNTAYLAAATANPRVPSQVTGALQLLLTNRQLAGQVADAGQSWARANTAWPLVAIKWEKHLQRVTA